MMYIEDEIWEVLNWEPLPTSEDFPICVMDRHERARYPEAFGPLYEPCNWLTTQDILLHYTGNYQIQFEVVWGKVVNWSIKKAKRL